MCSFPFYAVVLTMYHTYNSTVDLFSAQNHSNYRPVSTFSSVTISDSESIYDECHQSTYFLLLFVKPSLTQWLPNLKMNLIYPFAGSQGCICCIKKISQSKCRKVPRITLLSITSIKMPLAHYFLLAAMIRPCSSVTSSNMTFETLAVSVPQPHVAHVELNRPQKGNAMNAKFWA